MNASTKPFGRPVGARAGYTRLARLTLALWGAALPAYVICIFPSRGTPTLASSPFFWPGTIGFGLFYLVALARNWKRRAEPRAPGSGFRYARFALALLIAAVTGVASGFFYTPAITLVNGGISLGAARVEYAMVTPRKGGFALASPYWKDDFRWELPDAPHDLAAGSLAKMTLRTGLFGATWIQKVDFEALK